MNLFFYLQTAIIFFVLCFIKTQHFVKRKPVKTEKKYRNDRVPFQAGFTVVNFTTASLIHLGTGKYQIIKYVQRYTVFPVS